MVKWINVHRNDWSVVVRTSIIFIVRKNWAHSPSTTGSYGMHASTQTRYGWISKILIH